VYPTVPTIPSSLTSTSSGAQSGRLSSSSPASPFGAEVATVTAPFDGVLVGVLENPVVYPGNPLCHFVKVDEQVREILRES
jgi:hypothetical protein